MGTNSLNKDTSEAIRMVFQRLCEDEGSVRLIFNSFRGEFRVLAEAPDRVILNISDLERGQWRLKTGSRLTLHLLDRGLPFEAVVDFQGHGKFHGLEACQVTLPRLLRALDTHRLAEYVPSRPVPCPFADQQNNVKDGFALAFGEDGLELAPPEGTRILGDMLRLNATTSVELRAVIGENLALPMRVAYFGERVWGLHIADTADKKRLGKYRQWLLEAKHHQAQKDLARFAPGGMESAKLSSRREATARPAAQVKLLVDRDPLLLVLSGDEAFPTRLAEAVGRKFGIVALDPLKGPVLPSLAPLGAGADGWGRVKLVLIHHRQRTGTAMERCGQLLQQEKCPLPILLAGTGEECDLKRNRALAAGAVDYLTVEPFHILSVIRILDETLRMLG